MKVAIVGTVGVPALYGGFETLVENIIGENCSSDIQYTVFCSSKDISNKLDSYKGAALKYIPIKANGAQSILYDIVSLIKCIKGYDVILVLGVSGCIFLPLFRLLCRKKLIINIDGLEWKRNKWKSCVKWFLKFSESMAIKYADVIVADNQGIVDYVSKEYTKKTELIAYGADHVVQNVSDKESADILSNYNLTKENYAISICRIEPENNCDITLEAFSRSNEKLIFIGNWDRSQYGKELRVKYSAYSNILIVDPIYDLLITFVLRKNSKYYIHGHSAGGTNPSLVEAMYCGCNVLSYDVIYNRETTENKASYFSDTTSLLKLLTIDNNEISNNDYMLDIAKRRYTWKMVAKQYESLY